MSAFNANQQNRLIASFQYLDELLGTMLDKLEHPEIFLFPPYLQDVTPVQRKLLTDYLAQLQGAMRRFLNDQGMAAIRPKTGAAWALRIALSAAQTALEELSPKNLRGYGELTAEGEHEISALLAGLGAVIGQMDACLTLEGETGIDARLAQLDPGAPGAALLREMAGIVARYGLVEFRPTLAWLLERMEEPSLEVAFFGRVSSGKSSLINWLLEADVLPTGVTPVTTVPTRIVAGEIPRATVHFAGKEAVSVEIGRLADFVSEQGNPDNEKNVVKVAVEYPSPRLQQGVCLVDTPELGSLATAGAAQTLTYLPRCDVAVLLVDAAAGLAADDIAVAQSLQAAKADLLVLLSRADLLASADRQKMLAYLRTKFLAKLGADIPAWPVSVMGEARPLATRWLDEALMPRLNQQRDMAASSMRRKINGLRDAIISTLRQVATTPRRGREREYSQEERDIGKARAAIEAERSAVRRWGDQLPELMGALIDAAALSVARVWETDDSQADVTGVVAAALASSVHEWAHDLAAELAGVRSSTAKSLAYLKNSIASGEALAELPRPSGQPIFDATAIVRSVVLQRGITGALGNGVRQRRARKQLGRQLTVPLEQALSAYERALQSWGMDYLFELERSFSATVAPIEAGWRALGRAWGAETIVQDVARLNELDSGQSI